MKKFLPYFLISILGIIIPLYFSYGSVGNPNETCSYDATGSPINSPCQAPGLGTGGSCSISLYTTQSACEGAIPPGVWTSLGNPTGGGGSCSNPQHTTQASCAAPETWTPQGNPGVGSTGVYNLLAPIKTDGVDLSTFNPNGDGGGGLGAYLNIMIKIFIGICAVLAVIMIVIGGLEYMTSELTESKAHGKESIKNAILGLLLALGAWTILNQINPQLLKTDLSSLQNATVTVDIQDNVPQTPTNGKYGNNAAGADWAAIAGATVSLPSGVSAQTGECATVGQMGCLSTRGLNTSNLQSIQAGCNCQITLTEGTAYWQHGGASGRTTHGVGSSTVDIKGGADLDNYLSGGKPLVNFTRYTASGISSLYETNHWHIGG